jgi:hypothetical protein
MDFHNLGDVCQSLNFSLKPRFFVMRAAVAGADFFSTVLLNYLFVADCCASVKCQLTELHLYVYVFVGNLQIMQDLHIKVRNQSGKPGCLQILGSSQ